MKNFKVAAVIPADQLGFVMAFILEAKFELLECQLIAKEPMKSPYPAKPKLRKGRSQKSEELVLAAITTTRALDDTIHRKVLQKMMPQLTANAIDGALSGLTAAGKIVRVSPGTYAMPSAERDADSEGVDPTTGESGS